MRKLIIILIVGLAGCSQSYPASRIANELVDAGNKCVDHGGVYDYTLNSTMDKELGPFTYVKCRDEHIAKIENTNGK
jgi:hypothetical protein